MEIVKVCKKSELPEEQDVSSEWFLDSEGTICYVDEDFNGIAFAGGNAAVFIYNTLGHIDKVSALIEVEEIRITYRIKKGSDKQ